MLNTIGHYSPLIANNQPLFYMPLKFTVLLLLLSLPLCAQQKALRFVDSKTKKPITDAYVYLDSAFVAATDFNGNVKFDMGRSYSNLIVDHVAYYKRTITRDSILIKKVYSLKKHVDVLDEVYISDRQKKDTLAGIKTNFSWGNKAATFVAYQNDSYIKRLKFRVISVFGVKGMEYLPFMANIYTYDTVTKLPGKSLLPQDIAVENKNGNKWAEADISAYKIKVPKEGICIMFILPQLDRGVHDNDFVWSKVGRIAAVPALEIAGGDKKTFSFVDNYVLNGRSYSEKWARVEGNHYMMELVLEE
ncbi:hypothetical protein GR160_07460 [Flavobacterium sp. Sd200]|uniref:hypothetical protein n=1 Tax=Flavobacterium sp. Sd200 TaxID=2692211 RepID=UPI001369F088|nr:hypothetical protein [Flavobacterium sp. Sd200]MXN91064.1 hypothetical protein [Flavobacterium sp. Sd200]